MAKYDPSEDSEKLRVLVQFAASIANPLAKIVTSLTAEANILLGPDASRYLPASAVLLKRNARVADQIVDSLLGFAGLRPAKPEVLSVAAVVFSLGPLLRLVVGRSVAVTIDCADDLLPVHADMNHLERILCSFVARRTDAMPNGGAVTIHAANLTHRDTTGQVHHHVFITIYDTGRGIPPPQLRRLFEPVLVKIGPSLGLGLSAVYGMITQMRGQLVVDSGPPRGALFTLVLPAWTNSPSPTC
jgi:signal transduction histidine kinase